MQHSALTQALNTSAMYHSSTTSRVLRQIRPSLSEVMTKYFWYDLVWTTTVRCVLTRRQQTSTLIPSRLDYASSLCPSRSSANFNKLHHIQNAIARVVTLPKTYQISPILKRLHWLPIQPAQFRMWNIKYYLG